MSQKNNFLTQQDQNNTIWRSNYIKSQQLRNPRFFLNEVQSPISKISKKKEFQFLYDEIKTKLQNDLQRNLSNHNNLQKDILTNNLGKKVIAQFKLRISKSIEKYIEKQKDQSVLKIQSCQDYSEGEKSILTPMHLLLKARFSKFSKINSNQKLRKVISCHEQQNPFITQTQNSRAQSTRHQEQVVSSYFLRPQLSKR